MSNGPTLTERQWRAALAAYLRQEIQAIGGPAKLAARLTETEFHLGNRALGNKIRRGSFEASFLMEICRELGIENIDVAAVAQLAPPPESEG